MNKGKTATITHGKKLCKLAKSSFIYNVILASIKNLQKTFNMQTDYMEVPWQIIHVNNFHVN